MPAISKPTGLFQVGWKPWMALGLGAAVVRLVFVLALPQMPVVSDALIYDRLGWNLATGYVYSLSPPEPSAHFSPGYPLVLAGLYGVFGHDLQVVRIFQAVLSAGTCVLVGMLGAKLFNHLVGWSAGCLATIYPAFIFYSGLLLSETVFTFLLVLLLWMWLRAIHLRMGYWSVGVVVGLASLVRPEMLAFPLLVWLLEGWRRFKNPLWVFVVMWLVVLPWTVRNYAAFGRIIPVSTIGMRGIWLASYPEEWIEYYPDREPYRSVVAGLSAVEADFALGREGLRNIVRYPWSYLKMSTKRFGRFWVGSHSNRFVLLQVSFIDAFRGRAYGAFAAKLVLLGTNLALLALGAMGAIFAIPLRGGTLAIFLIVLYKTAVHTFIFATSRYQVPIMPFVLIFAALALVTLVERGWGALKLVRRG